jgi:septum formation protein
MLSRLRLPFQKVVSPFKEQNNRPGGGDPARVAADNALCKARSVFAMEGGLPPSGVIVGADTIVVLDGEILGKPSGREEAGLMLQRLSGRTHTVITALALVQIPGGAETSGWEETRVTFRKLSGEDISLYLSTGEADDKAGAYGIQEFGSFLVEKVEGDYFNVVGLPILRLYTMMKSTGVDLFHLSVASGKEEPLDVI